MPERIRRLRLYMKRERAFPSLFSALVALVLVALLIREVDGRIRPVLETAAASQATNLITQAINAAVDDCLEQNGMSYADFITVRTDASGKVTSLTGNTVANSRFKRLVVDAVIERLNELDQDALGVPLGTLSGQVLLSGMGPSVRVRVESVGSVTADYSNSFSEAGVNQTLHQVCLNVTATVYLFLPGEILPVSVSSSICVAETVIVGETPNTYLNMQKD